MIISTYGSRFYGGQIDRIEQGFIQLGHEISFNNPDLIYSNDPVHFSQAVAKWEDYCRKPKLLLNILDCPSFLPNWINIEKEWYPKLILANKITCISETVKADIKEYFNIDSEVIYNPMKPVHYMGVMKKDIICLFVGRCNAPNKRVKELIWPLYSNGLIKYFGEKCVHFVGSENSGFGVNHGVVSDEELNVLYNRSLFGLISSKQEGLNLPLIEMCCTRVMPIICRDMSTAVEFGDPEFFCDPTPESMFYKMKEISGDLQKYSDILFPYAQKYFTQFSPKSIAENILRVYESIVY